MTVPVSVVSPVPGAARTSRLPASVCRMDRHLYFHLQTDCSKPRFLRDSPSLRSQRRLSPGRENGVPFSGGHTGEGRDRLGIGIFLASVSPPWSCDSLDTAGGPGPPGLCSRPAMEEEAVTGDSLEEEAVKARSLHRSSPRPSPRV